MPIIEGRYTMTDTARELEAQAAKARAETRAERAEKERLQEALFRAHETAALWFTLCVVLLIAAGVLVAYAALAT